MSVLVDTNVLLDIATEDPTWFDWFASQLARAAARFLYRRPCGGGWVQLAHA